MKRLVSALAAGLMLCGCTRFVVITPMTAEEYEEQMTLAYLDYIGAGDKLYDCIEATDADGVTEVRDECIKALDILIGLPAPAELSEQEEKFDSALADEKEYVELACEFVQLRSDGSDKKRLLEVTEQIQEYLEENRMGMAVNDMIAALNSIQQ